MITNKQGVKPKQVMNKSKRFNKKQAVRFVLVPGRDENGNPTTTFKPVETKNKLSKKQREKIISQVSDYQIEIDGKPVDESDIPAYVLEQIKGRADLIFNKNNPDMFAENDEAEEDVMEEQFDDYYEDDEEGQIIPEQEYMGYNKDDEQIVQQNDKQDKQEKEVDLDGKKYKLTQHQMKMLDEVLPKDYENYQIEGVQFVKYNEDGNRLDQQESYKKYIADPVQRRGIVDSFDYAPPKPVDVVDNDLEGQALKGDMKQIEDALNYEGQEEAYQQMEDDFFSKLIGGDEKKQSKPKQKKQKVSQNEAFKKKPNVEQVITKPKIQQAKKQKITENKKAEKYHSKMDELEGDEDYEQYEDEDGQWQQGDQEITDQMLDKAIQQFDRKHEQAEGSEHVNYIPGTGVPVNMKGMSLIKFIEEREGCTGKDGELDWRTLTKKQKKQYMKNKKIREAHEQVRERQIKQKLEGKQNVKAEDLHLKKYIEFIPYSEDHVMQQAIARDQKEEVNIDQIEDEKDFETESDQDDIVSYRAKTSIISSNLATVEEVSNIRKKKQEKQQKQEQIKNIEKVKVVPQRRNRNETAQERKARKDKLKELKKEKKEQRIEFNEIFEAERKKAMKRNTNTSNSNPLHKVAYVKIV